MPSNISKEQFWKLYEGLPQELKDALFAPETGDYIEEICEKNNVEKISEIVELVGRVLLGFVLPEDFQNVLEKELKIKKDIAKKTSQEINRFIFYPVKESLASLHKIEAKPTNGVQAAMPTVTAKPTKPYAGGEIPAATPAPIIQKQDSYKETIE